MTEKLPDGQWVETPFISQFERDEFIRHSTPNPAYVTVSEEEAERSTITLRGDEALKILDPRLVARMTKKP